MQFLEKTVEIKMPVRSVYNQWTQFEKFPEFMDGIQKVKQLDDTHLHWEAKIAGKEKKWDAEITEQHPDEKISWRSTNGPKNQGEVIFDKVNSDTTRVRLSLEYEPESFIEEIGSELGIVSSKVEESLEKFKSFIEERGKETGAWRGEVST